MSDIITKIETEKFFASETHRDKIVDYLGDLKDVIESLDRARHEIGNVHVKMKQECIDLSNAVDNQDVKAIKRILKRSAEIKEYVKNFGKNTIDSFAVESDEETFDVQEFFKK